MYHYGGCFFMEISVSRRQSKRLGLCRYEQTKETASRNDSSCPDDANYMTSSLQGVTKKRKKHQFTRDHNRPTFGNVTTSNKNQHSEQHQNHIPTEFTFDFIWILWVYEKIKNSNYRRGQTKSKFQFREIKKRSKISDKNRRKNTVVWKKIRWSDYIHVCTT